MGARDQPNSQRGYRHRWQDAASFTRSAGGQESTAPGECLGRRKSRRSGSTRQPREKSNEITAIPLLLKQLALKGCLVTIDAMGTQTKIAAQITEQEGDYALALKDNQGNLYEEVQATFALAEKDGWADLPEPSVRFVEKGHGRLETREYWTLSDPALLAYLDPEQKWKGLRGIGMVRSHRQIAEEVSQEIRYFLLSFPSVNTFATEVRSHWGH